MILGMIIIIATNELIIIPPSTMVHGKPSDRCHDNILTYHNV